MNAKEFVSAFPDAAAVLAAHDSAGVDIKVFSLAVVLWHNIAVQDKINLLSETLS